MSKHRKCRYCAYHAFIDEFGALDSSMHMDSSSSSTSDSQTAKRKAIAEMNVLVLPISGGGFATQLGLILHLHHLDFAPNR